MSGDPGRVGQERAANGSAIQAPPMGLLQTRCGCRRVVEIPTDLPQTITVELAPVPGAEEDVRVFIFTGRTVRGSAGPPMMLYQEGPQPPKKPVSRIVIPGMTPPAGLVPQRR